MLTVWAGHSVLFGLNSVLFGLNRVCCLGWIVCAHSVGWIVGAV